MNVIDEGDFKRFQMSFGWISYITCSTSNLYAALVIVPLYVISYHCYKDNPLYGYMFTYEKKKTKHKLHALYIIIGIYYVWVQLS